MSISDALMTVLWHSYHIAVIEATAAVVAAAAPDETYSDHTLTSYISPIPNQVIQYKPHTELLRRLPLRLLTHIRRR